MSQGCPFSIVFYETLKVIVLLSFVKTFTVVDFTEVTSQRKGVRLLSSEFGLSA